MHAPEHLPKTLLINPVVREEDDPKHVPYGLALLSAILKKNRIPFQVYDANAHRGGDEELERVLKADRWEVVACGGISTVYGYAKKAFRMAREIVPQALRVSGGGLVTSMPEDLMNLIPDIQVGVVGEAFDTFPQLLRARAEGGNSFFFIPGLVLRGAHGLPFLTKKRDLVQDIDCLPYPDWDSFPLDIYFRNSSLLYSEEAFSSKRRLDLNASFGCPFICRFCFHLGTAGDLQYVDKGPLEQEAIFTHDRVNRWHSARYVVNLAKHVRDRYGVDFILFIDENLIAMDTASRHKWLPELCRLWIDEGLQPQCCRDRVPHDPGTCRGVHFGATSHAALIRPDTLKILKEAGCSQLLYGLESFSARVLKNVGKGSTPESNEKAVRITLDAGIRPIPNQMMGFPDDFFDSLIDCVEAWHRLGIKCKPFFATAYPGTEWWNRYKARILAQYDGDMDALMGDLGDATRITTNLCDNLNDVELYGLRELMVNGDIEGIRRYEKLWRGVYGDPLFSDVKWARASRSRNSPATASVKSS